MTDYQQYKGKRAIVLLRVSTEEQEKHFGFPSQLEQIRKKLIDPLKLKVDPKHIIEDTYTGLEFKERDALKLIERLADEFGNPNDPVLLLADCLDRIGRKGLQRELYRAQLRQKGMRILTTDPAEHSDDDSLMGEMIRYMLGFKAEMELNDIRRRTMNGKHAKVTGEKDPTGRKKLAGTGTRRYGYTWTYSEKKHTRDGWTLNTEIIKVIDDVEWTEVKVIHFIFDEADNGTPIRQIAIKLNEMGIPPMKGKQWQPSSVGAILNCAEYAQGFTYQFKRRNTERVPGKKYTRSVPRPLDEQVQVPIPQIIDMKQYQRVKERRAKNKKLASRNNQNPQQTLLRAGIVHCAQCGGGMSVKRTRGFYKDKEGPDADRLSYSCNRRNHDLGHCPHGSSIDARHLDETVWNYAVSVMRNPVQIDKDMQDVVRKNDPEKRRKKAQRELAEIKKALSTFRQQLADMMMKGTLDSETETFLSAKLQELTEAEQQKKSEIYSEEREQAKFQELQEEVTALYQYCQSTIEKVDDPNYELSYAEKREAIEKLGIQVDVYKKGNAHRVKMACKPPRIVSIAS